MVFLGGVTPIYYNLRGVGHAGGVMPAPSRNFFFFARKVLKGM